MPDTELPDLESVTNVDVAQPERMEFDDVPCTPSKHEGRPAIVFVMASNDDPVRKIKTCTACNMVLKEVTFEDAHAITLEGPGATVSRAKNNPDEERVDKVPLDELTDEPRENVNGIGLSPDGEVLLSISDPTADGPTLDDYDGDDTEYVLTDGDGEVIEGEVYDDPDAAVDARASQMAEHPDGDAVTVEPRPAGESA